MTPHRRFAPFQMEITDEDDFIITSATEEYLIWLKDQVEDPDVKRRPEELRSYQSQIKAMNDFWDRYVKARDTASRDPAVTGFGDDPGDVPEDLKER